MARGQGVRGLSGTITLDESMEVLGDEKASLSSKAASKDKVGAAAIVR